MNQQTLDELAKEIIEMKLQVADEFLAEFDEILGKIASPEKLIGKPKELWTLQDIQRLSTVYGTKEPNPLSRAIFQREYDEYQALSGEQQNVHGSISSP